MNKIYLISQTESHLTQRGKRHPNLADFLSTKGIDIEYLSSSFYHAEKRHFSKEQVVEANQQINYKLHIIRSFAYYRNIGLMRILSNLQFSLKVYRYLKRQSLNNAIIIVPSRPVEIIRFLSKLKKNSPNLKVILDIRDVWPDAFNIKNTFLKKAFGSYCNFFLKNKVNTFDDYVHTCPNFTSWLNKYAPQVNSTFIPLGYDPNRFNLKTIDSITKIRESNHNINFVYIGLLQYQIEILPFIKSIQDDDRFSLTLFGDEGTGEKYTSVKSYVESHEINNVFFKGRIDQDKVGKTLSKYDIGLMPMKAKFAFPNKVFDYIAMKLPVFSMGHHDTSTFVIENNIGWVTTFEVEDIKNVLNGIVNSNNKQIEMYTDKLSRIKDNFSRENLYNKFLKIIES